MASTLENRQEQREQYRTLRLIENWLEMPMFVLSLAWVALLVVELIWGLVSPLELIVTVIWIAFVIEFLLRFVLAPKKTSFLRRNWISVFALALPALRVLRVTRVLYVLRVGRAIRGLTMARVLTAFHRGLRTLRANMGRYGFGYVVMLTVLVTILGAAGIYTFERRAESGIETFGDALWFSAMMVTTSGSNFWPATLEGRLLCFLLALYAFAIFGYVTATIATLLVGEEIFTPAARKAVEAESIASLQREIAQLNERLMGRQSAPRVP